jgi:hypothetical protein
MVSFKRKDVSNLHVRARRLSGGQIKVFAGRYIDNPFEWSLELGRIEINKARGEWTEYTIPVNLDDDILQNNPWDLNFIFESNNGSNTGELFELSEFWLK